MDNDSRAFLLALTAMNMRVITELAARTGDLDAARQQMDAFEASILQYINKLQISLGPDEGPEDLERLRARARGLVSDWMASFKFV